MSEKMDYAKVATSIANIIAKTGQPLTETQRIVMAGALGAHLEQANRRPHPAPVGVRVPDAHLLELDYGESPGESAGAVACEIGDYSALERREWATVLFNDRKIAECYSNEDAAIVANALNAYRESAIHGGQRSSTEACQTIALGRMKDNEENRLRYGTGYISGWNQYDKHLSTNSQPGAFPSESISRLQAAVAENNGSTVTITKADACAIGNAMTRPGAVVSDEVVAHFVEETAKIISGAPFPSGRSMTKAREISDMALRTLTNTDKGNNND